MPEPKPKRIVASPERQLDDISDHLGEVLRRADDLLAEWSRFGDAVRAQVDREAQAIATTVGDSVDRAVIRGVEKALVDQVGVRVNAIATELGRVEARARALARTATEDRTRQRALLWAILAGIIGANALLAVLLLRDGGSSAAPQPATFAPPPPVPAVTAPAAGSGSGSGSAAVVPAAGGSGSAPPAASSGSGSGSAGSAAPPAVEKAAAPPIAPVKQPKPVVAPKTHGAPGHR